MYALPGLIDMHTHIGPVTSVPAEYLFKLWMGHGVTTIREVLAGNGIDWMLEERGKSDRNEITAPRIKSYVRFGMGAKSAITTPQQAREWVDWLAGRGADGIKFFGTPPQIIAAALDEAKKKGLRSAAHLDQTGVARVNALTAARRRRRAVSPPDHPRGDAH